jgi:hypothetical protein
MGAPYALSSDLVSAWPAKSLEVAQYIDGQLPLIAMTQNAQTGTTYTLAATDFTKLVTLSNASPVTVTVPLESSVAWVAGTQLRLMNLGAGLVTVVGAGGVTINGSPLTLAQYKQGTLTKTGTNIWTFVGSPSAPGMELVTPTSVAGSGVTLSGGAVSFSASTTVSVNGCFTAEYDNYRFELVTTASAADTQLSYRSRVAGTDNSSTNYNSQMLQGATSTAAASASTGATSWRFSDIGSANENICSGDIFSPFIARATAFNNIRYASAGSNAINAGAMTVTTSYDGFTIFPASGNITGKLRIYGLRNS